MSRKYFGTDGVRGLYGGPVINEDFAERLGVAAGRFASRLSTPGRQRAVLGRDTRASGASLIEAVAAGLSSVGIECCLLDVVPTPAVAKAVLAENAVLGVVITASHNPACDNGIKFFGPDGQKLSDAEELDIERLIPEDRPTLTARPTLRANGLQSYLAMVRGLLPAGALRGWKIVVDTANGSTCATSPVVLRECGAEVFQIGDAPDGTNINAGVGSEHPAKMLARVKEVGARLGIAHDGDGDRCVLCDEGGVLLDGDELITILALDALERGALRDGIVVVTMQSNLGVDAAIRAAGGRVFRTGIGDRYVSEKMVAEGATLGGESSGHVICADVAQTGDGLVAALRVLAVMIRRGKPLSELRKALVKFPQSSLNLRVREKRDLAALPHLPIAIQAAETALGERGRVLVRYSGTESKLRILVEGPTLEEVNACIRRLETVARTDLEIV